MSLHQLIHWSPAQIAVFRRQILRESVLTFSRHWTQETGEAVSPRSVEGWESMSRPRRPAYFVRCQFSAAFRHLATHPNNRHLWQLLPANPDTHTP